VTVRTFLTLIQHSHLVSCDWPRRTEAVWMLSKWKYTKYEVPSPLKLSKDFETWRRPEAFRFVMAIVIKCMKALSK
jgi:hypothetical protein